MNSLRQKMIDAMIVRKLSIFTQQSYLYCVTQLEKHSLQSLDNISDKDIRAFFLYLDKEGELSSASCRRYHNALRFLYREVLGRSDFDCETPLPKIRLRKPESLTHQEVLAIVNSPADVMHRMLLQTCYGCGLRVSELVGLQVNHVDLERQMLRIRKVRGDEDRHVHLSPALVKQLDDYLTWYRPEQWLFGRKKPTQQLSISLVQQIFQKAKRDAGVDKYGSIYNLRRTYLAEVH